MGKLIDIENIDYVRLEDSLHCLEHHKGDEVECVICAPTVEAIPKDQYEARLKADMVTMLTEIQMEIEEHSYIYADGVSKKSDYVSCEDMHDLIRIMINNLRREHESSM